MPRVVHAPGRVNLIGDHTDYVGGLVMPMAIDTGITITVQPGGDVVELRSSLDPQPCSFDLPVRNDPATIEPAWARFVAAMARHMGATIGMTGTVDSTLPAGAGLSSSASLLCAVGLALGFDGTPHELATTARAAEHEATGVPTGIMDQLCIASAVEGHAVLIDCRAESVEPVPVPSEARIAVRFVEPRTLVGSGYADRVTECARAEADIGPLRDATVDDLAALDDPVLVRRSRHVITENERVRHVARAFRSGDLDAAGAVMNDGHTSLRDDYEISTPALDAAVDAARAIPGVFGARLTGGGFGGSIVALAAPGVRFGDEWTIVRPSGPARVL
ncbi:MAG: galactokinase family protein [Actinomycetota bacterium]